jgi:hypothetical protein
MQKRSFLRSLTLFVCAFASSFIQAQSVAQDGYLLGSIRYDNYRREIHAADYNWGEWKLLMPAGTPVRGDFAMENSWRKRWAWSIKSDSVELTLTNDNHRNIPDAEFLKRYITSVDPRPKIATFPKEIQEAIALGRVAVGVTREQVIMALGTPPDKENRNIIASTWVYFWGSFDNIKVKFNADDKVGEVNGLPFALADMLYPIPKK